MKNYILHLLGMLFGFSSGLSGNVTEIVAAVLVEEARGEGYVGMHAVMNVINNRANGDQSKYLRVVMKPKHFSCLDRVTSGKDTLKSFVKLAKTRHSWAIATRLAESDVLLDSTGGANHYHTTYVKPYWADPDKVTARIKRHIFYKL